MKNQSFTDKNDSYYNFDKARIASLIPEGPNRVLDVGCAAGQLGRRLRDENKAIEVVGVEIFDAPAAEAGKHYDRVYVDDIETLILEPADYFDFVVCGDILEHLRDPWATIDKLHGLVKPGGAILASTPNIRYWRILRDLAVLGKWEYVDSGILDNTHLRFFTSSSFVEAFHRAGFEVVSHDIWIYGNKQSRVNRVTGGLFRELLGSQLLVKAVKKAA